MKLKKGDKAPEFSGETLNGKVSLNDFKGKNVVLYFYPRDNTPGCTIEAIDFSKDKEDFSKANTVILGVSKDNLVSHEKFCTKRKLTINLISDEDLKIHKSYGVWAKKKFLGKEFLGTIRSTFLIDSKGKLAKIWPSVKVKGHVEEVLKTVKGI
tara:strand:- start:705 stop:1166 length:462 start_codon:yes stop_codon:yes gene_type:complete